MRTIFLLFFSLVFVIGLFFSLWNLHPVQINLWKNWGVELPLALALTVELLAGFIIGLTASLIHTIKLKADCSKIKKKLMKTEKELHNLRAKNP